jgi:hypothetical protein
MHLLRQGPLSGAPLSEQKNGHIGGGYVGDHLFQRPHSGTHAGNKSLSRRAAYDFTPQSGTFALHFHDPKSDFGTY